MDNSYAIAYAQLYNQHWWWRVRERILFDKIASLLTKPPASARILDVGCGAGLFFEALQRLGDVEGIESDATIVEQSGLWRDRIRHADLDGSYAPGHKYDAILMLDVIEHVPEPDRMLGFARALLAEGGFVLITVPAFQWLWTSHDDINHHLRRYNARDLRATVESAGLEVNEMSFFFQSLVFPKLLQRVKESVLGAQPGTPRIPSKSVNALVQAWYRLEFAVARWLPFGGSLLAVARVPHAARTDPGRA